MGFPRYIASYVHGDTSHKIHHQNVQSYVVRMLLPYFSIDNARVIYTKKV